VVGDVRDDKRAGGDQRPTADREAGQNGGVCAQGGAELDEGRNHRPIVGALGQAVIGHRSRVPVVRKAHVWTDEDSVLDSDALEYGNVVLNLDALTNLDILANVNALSHHTVGADTGA